MRDLLQEARKSHEVTEDTLIEYTDTILQVFDANKDGKLQLSEMAKYVLFYISFIQPSVFYTVLSSREEQEDNKLI